MKIENDKLERTNFLNKLFKIFKEIENDNNGLTVVLNGSYGTGKTTILDFIIEVNNQKNEYNVIKYDAWDNNFFDNPFIPILYSISKLKSTTTKIKETALDVIKKLPKAILNTLAKTNGVDLQDFIPNGNIFSDFDSYNSAIENLKNVLTDYCKEKKTLFLVDELDRCLPDYQIKVLESLYHLFDVPNLIVVIALDKLQLETSIQTMFGKNFNVAGYLAKFINLTIDLPPGTTYDYIPALMNFEISGDTNLIKQKIADIFKIMKMPIRECLRATNELNMIYKKNSQTYYYYVPVLTCLLLLFKKEYNDIYHKYFYHRNSYRLIEKDIEHTLYYNFLDDISGTKFEEVINYWLRDDNYGVVFLIRFIDLFYPIRFISEDSLMKYFNSNDEKIKSHISQLDGYPIQYTLLNALLNNIDSFF